MYECKEAEQVVMLKNFEKMLQKLNKLDNSLEINFTFFDLNRKRQLIKEDSTRFCALALENLTIDAKLDIDGEFVKTLGALIGKISPGFQESPIIGFLELFEETSFNIEYN